MGGVNYRVRPVSALQELSIEAVESSGRFEFNLLGTAPFHLDVRCCLHTARIALRLPDAFTW